MLRNLVLPFELIDKMSGEGSPSPLKPHRESKMSVTCGTSLCLPLQKPRLRKPTYFSTGDICYYCFCSAAADVTQLWISICEGAEDYALNIFSIHPAANSANFQGNLWRAIQMFRKLPALLLAVFCIVLLPCSSAWPPLPWEFIHPQPPQEMIVVFCFQNCSLHLRKS